jgi:hypothetical protein
VFELRLLSQESLCHSEMNFFFHQRHLSASIFQKKIQIEKTVKFSNAFQCSFLHFFCNLVVDYHASNEETLN